MVPSRVHDTLVESQWTTPFSIKKKKEADSPWRRQYKIPTKTSRQIITTTTAIAALAPSDKDFFGSTINCDR